MKMVEEGHTTTTTSCLKYFNVLYKQFTDFTCTMFLDVAYLFQIMSELEEEQQATLEQSSDTISIESYDTTQLIQGNCYKEILPALF